MCKPDCFTLDDDRPFIRDLLEEYAISIASVRVMLLADDEGSELYHKGDNSERYDDIWILRFLLSHKGDTESAFEAALKTMKFRDEKKMNELGDIRHRLRNHGFDGNNEIGEPLPFYQEYEKFCGKHCACITLPDKNRGIVTYIDVGQLDMNGLAESMDDDAMQEFMLHSNEAVFQILDEVTRRTGRLTKVVKILDIGNVSYKNINRAYIQREAAASKTLQDYYPQLLGSVFIANSPSWASALWTALRPFFPARVVAKVDFLTAESYLSLFSESKINIAPLQRYVSELHIPVRYGGKNEQWPVSSAGSHFTPTSGNSTFQIKTC